VARGYDPLTCRQCRTRIMEGAAWAVALSPTGGHGRARGYAGGAVSDATGLRPLAGRRWRGRRGTGDSRWAAIGCHGRLVEGGESEEKEEKQQSAVVLGQLKDGQWRSGHGEP
jgi:hypothetical protein